LLDDESKGRNDVFRRFESHVSLRRPTTHFDPQIERSQTTKNPLVGDVVTDETHRSKTPLISELFDRDPLVQREDPGFDDRGALEKVPPITGCHVSEVSDQILSPTCFHLTNVQRNAVRFPLDPRAFHSVDEHAHIGLETIDFARTIFDRLSTVVPFTSMTADQTNVFGYLECCTSIVT